MDNMDKMICKRVFELLRMKTRGYLTVNIENNTLNMGVKWYNYEFWYYFDNLDHAIINGEFSCQDAAVIFIREWKKYLHDQINEQVFYKSDWK